MDRERLVSLIGADAAEHIDDFDLDEEHERMELVEEFLPLPDGIPRRDLQMAMRTVVVTQILQDDPPETWQTVVRLRDLGFDREHLLGQISLVVGQHFMEAVANETEFEVDAYIADLAALPMPTPEMASAAILDAARTNPETVVEPLLDAVIDSLGGSRAVEGLVHHVFDQMVAGPVHILPADRVVSMCDAVADTVFTHRISDAELELGVISAGFDLGAFSRFDEVRLPDGTELDQFSVEDGHLAWRGPDGWLDRFEPDDLLAVSIDVEPVKVPGVDLATDDGLDAGVGLAVTAATVSIESVAATDDIDKPPADLVARVRAAYDEIVTSGDLPVGGGELALLLAAEGPELWRQPNAPLDDLCVAAGLERNGGFAAHDAATWRRGLVYRRIEEAAGYTTDPDSMMALALAFKVLDDPDADPDEVCDALAECAEPELLDILADVLIPHRLDPSDEFERDRVESPGRLWDLVNRATAVARRGREVATAEYLACVLHERAGAPEIAEQHLKRAHDARPTLGPVVERMGWYRFDRGDARGATRWWRELDQEHPAAAVIAPFTSPGSGGSGGLAGGGRKLGRNDPCWCGSGKKFKQCHQNATELPALPDRIAWLVRKTSTWLDHVAGDLRSTVMEMAMARATGDVDAEAWDFTDLDEDELGPLFTDAFADPIVFDTTLHEGGLFGVFLHERGALLPDDEQLLTASWRLVERSVHEITAVDRGEGFAVRDLATGDVHEVRERSASRRLEVGDRICARIVPDGATHQILGGVFVVEVGTEEAVLDLCAARDGVGLCAWAGRLAQPPRIMHQPGLAESMFDTDLLDATVEALGDDADEATVQAALREELQRQAQANWLDEHVPALGGLTPREAAADPTRREQLERLLDDFEARDHRLGSLADAGFAPFTYDVPALRRELGLA